MTEDKRYFATCMTCDVGTTRTANDLVEFIDKHLGHCLMVDTKVEMD